MPLCNHFFLQWIRGSSFYRNCGPALLRGITRQFGFINWVGDVNLPQEIDSKTNISSPSSGQMMKR